MLTSVWRSQENERFDILGYYILGEIDENLGSGEFGDIVNIRAPARSKPGRNTLTADVRNVEYKGGIELQGDVAEAGLTRSHFLQWLAKRQTSRSATASMSGTAGFGPVFAAV